MMNLNNTPSAGPLTEEDMERYRNLHRAYIPMGCGQSVLGPRKEIAGLRSGRLVARTYIGSGKWLCLCDCSNTHIVKTASLINGHAKSCGCLRKAMVVERNRQSATHGMSKSPTYVVWRGMVARCSATSTIPTYQAYRERGITVCDRWMSFSGFLSDMGVRPDGTTLDRIDNDGNYEPGNCRWATPTQQQGNKRNNRLLTYQGITTYVAEWARRVGLPHRVLKDRLRVGMPHDKALSMPVRKRG